MNEQAAVDSKGWNKAQEVMNLAEKSGWTMLLTPHRTYVTLEMTRGVESIEIAWLDKGTLMATRRYVSATRNTRSFSFAEALRIIASAADVGLPRRNPDVPVIPIDDEVIAAGRHVDVISTVATPKAWIMGCSSCKMPMTADPHHLPGCEVALVQEVLTDRGLPPVALNVEQLLTLIGDVQREDAERVADTPAWVCRSRVKATRVSRRRAQRGAMAR